MPRGRRREAPARRPRAGRNDPLLLREHPVRRVHRGHRVVGAGNTTGIQAVGRTAARLHCTPCCTRRIRSPAGGPARRGTSGQDEGDAEHHGRRFCSVASEGPDRRRSSSGTGRTRRRKSSCRPRKATTAPATRPITATAAEGEDHQRPAREEERSAQEASPRVHGGTPEPRRAARPSPEARPAPPATGRRRRRRALRRRDRAPGAASPGERVEEAGRRRLRDRLRGQRAHHGAGGGEHEHQEEAGEGDVESASRRDSRGGEPRRCPGRGTRCRRRPGPVPSRRGDVRVATGRGGSGWRGSPELGDHRRQPLGDPGREGRARVREGSPQDQVHVGDGQEEVAPPPGEGGDVCAPCGHSHDGRKASEARRRER